MGNGNENQTQDIQIEMEKKKKSIVNHFSVDADFCQGTSSSAIQREDNDPRLRSF